MLDQLLNLVKEQAGNAIANNPAVSGDQNAGVMAEAVSSIKNGLQQELANGGLQNVLGMFSGGGSGAGSSLVQNITGNFAQNIAGKFGMSGDQAQSLASSVIPGVMSSLVNKTNDPNDSSFNIQGIFDHLTGGQTSGMNISNLLSSVTGGGQGGGMNLQEVAGMIGNAAQGQQGSSGGGLLNTIKGFFGGGN